MRRDRVNSAAGTRDVDEERLIATFIELIMIDSPSFGEREIGGVLSARLKALGCSVERQDYGPSFNLIGRKKGVRHGASPLILSGHMDTIEPTAGIRYEMKDGVIRSTGGTVLGADDKSAIAQILEALAVLQERAIAHGDLEIIFTSAEEKGLCGARSLDPGRLRARCALVLDSSGPVGRLVTSAPTHCTYEMTVTGRPAHAGIEPERGLSAIRVAGQIVSGVPDGRIDAQTTANIGMIQGGTATNVVPKEVRIRGEVRSRNAAALQRTKRAVFRMARDIARRAGASVSIEDKEEYRSFTIAEDEPFLRYMDGVLRGCGIDPVHTASGGGSDANIFNERGFLALNLSNGMQEVHSTSEHIAVRDLVDGARVVIEAVAGFGGIERLKAASPRGRYRSRGRS